MKRKKSIRVLGEKRAKQKNHMTAKEAAGRVGLTGMQMMHIHGLQGSLIKHSQSHYMSITEYLWVYLTCNVWKTAVKKELEVICNCSTKNKKYFSWQQKVLSCLLYG